jgi:hypothetical protein
VKLIEGDAVHAQRATTLFAGRRQMFRTTIRNPSPAGSSQPSLGCNQDGRAITWPGGQGTSDEPFVMATLIVVPAIGVRGVEQGDAGIERRVDYGDPGRLVAIRFGREPHASESKGLLGRHDPALYGRTVTFRILTGVTGWLIAPSPPIVVGTPASASTVSMPEVTRAKITYWGGSG